MEWGRTNPILWWIGLLGEAGADAFHGVEVEREIVDGVEGGGEGLACYE